MAVKSTGNNKLKSKREWNLKRWSEREREENVTWNRNYQKVDGEIQLHVSLRLNWKNQANPSESMRNDSIDEENNALVEVKKETILHVQSVKRGERLPKYSDNKNKEKNRESKKFINEKKQFRADRETARSSSEVTRNELASVMSFLV